LQLRYLIGSGKAWQLGRSIWSDEVTRALDEELAARGASVARTWGAHYNTDYHVYRLIMALPAAQAEALLLKHWDHLRFCDLFVQVALHVATPRLLGTRRASNRELPESERAVQVHTQELRHWWEGMARGHAQKIRIPRIPR
jgi:hypothetical protein